MLYNILYVGCGYLNGMLVLCIAQFFTFVGAILSLATLGDCSFATIDLIAFDLSTAQDRSFLKESRGVGFVTFQLNDGYVLRDMLCSWKCLSRNLSMFEEGFG